MIKDIERISLFTGHFGSGKTEMAINYSLRLALQGHDVVLVDLDIVNPFFRSTEVRNILEQGGVKVLSPNFANTTVDVPSLPPEIYSVFQNKKLKVVFDVGGDDSGATALGAYYPYFMKDNYRMFYVINIRRPLSSNADDIIQLLKAIQSHSRLEVTDLVNNTNLSYETEICDIIDGQAVVEQVSQRLGIPVSYIAGVPQVLEGLPEGSREKAFPLKIYMTPPWRKLE